MPSAFNGRWRCRADCVSLSLCGEVFGRAIRHVVVRHDSGSVRATIQLEQVDGAKAAGQAAGRWDEIAIELTSGKESIAGFELRPSELVVAETLRGEEGESAQTVRAQLGRLVPAILRGLEAVARAESAGLPWVLGAAATSGPGAGTLIGEGWTKE